MAKQNILELNGKRYNALTGDLISDTAVTAPKKSVAAPKGPKFVDGYVKRSSHQLAQLHATPRIQHPKNQVMTNSVPVLPVKSKAAKTAPKPMQAHKPEHSKTLMRHVVKKPEPSLKRTTKVHTRTDILAKAPAMLVAPKASSHAVDPTRTQRAASVAKHEKVNKFLKPSFGSLQSLASSRPTITPTSTNQPAKYNLESIRPVVKPAAATGGTNDVFARALERATSHEHKATAHSPAKTRRKLPKLLISGSAVAVTIFVLAGFIAYQNQANLSLRVANSHAGFTASLPSYKPAGFKVGNFQYSPGSVAIDYKGSSGNFQLTQRVTNWDNEALLDNFILGTAKSYQRVNSGDRTIYIYDDNNATWVNKGVWYQVTTNGSLGSSQLLKLANSI